MKDKIDYSKIIINYSNLYKMKKSKINKMKLIMLIIKILMNKNNRYYSQF